MFSIFTILLIKPHKLPKMADFAAKYTNANLAQDAAAYDSAWFLAWNEKLGQLQPSAHNGFTVGLLVR